MDLGSPMFTDNASIYCLSNVIDGDHEWHFGLSHGLWDEWIWPDGCRQGGDQTINPSEGLWRIVNQPYVSANACIDKGRGDKPLNNIEKWSLQRATTIEW